MTTLALSLTTALDLIVSGDPAVRQIVGLSLQVSGAACAIGAAFGLWLGAWLAVARFPGHALAVWLLNTLLALPSVVVGLIVYLMLSRAGPLGELGLLFTPTAMVIAQAEACAVDIKHPFRTARSLWSSKWFAAGMLVGAGAWGACCAFFLACCAFCLACCACSSYDWIEL